ncbi:hypothetical protein CANTEDRAFT_113061 [Yamadazyma tenuis ATCC 10573]|nr:uncharacterized protein CANTEDRAFT_113061 [Yamadazyma tenuis ATCC 10573]EGV65342.1 hypothetical protein CANTEDRAFT_113061 [Yamadazyma tenuis ATCC 10573]
MVNSHFYILYNDLFYERIISTFGEDIVPVLIKVLPWLRTYIKTLDSFRRESRSVISSRLSLPFYVDEENPLNTIYIKDSWRYVYSILRNKRLFAEYGDYKIDEPTNYIYNHFVEINRTYLLSYTKTMWLAPGDYNLNIGLVVKHGNGLGTTKFEIRYENDRGDIVTETFYPPTNINDILPKKQFCLLRLGEFSIPSSRTNHDSFNKSHHPKLYKVELTMEEIGLYLKSGFRIFFIDLAQPTVLFNQFDLLYYTVRETDYRYFINIPLKNFYKALNYIQNGNSDNLSYQIALKDYGTGDPFEILDSYDDKFVTDSLHNRKAGQVDSLTDLKDPKAISDKQLMRYADFYFNKAFIRRYFKFNTIYQRRQFVNRYGDFELDWKKGENQNFNSTNTYDSYSHSQSTFSLVAPDTNRACIYDLHGLKWKIPTLSEL